MAFSTKPLNPHKPGWLWKLIVRIFAILTALLGIACVSFMYKWARGYPHQGEFQGDKFILPWLLFTLSLSTLYSFLTLLLPTLSPHLLPTSASFACDALLTLSHLASGIWLILAATAVIDNSSVLALYLIDGIPFQYNVPSSYSNLQSQHRASIEIVGIAATFLVAILHLPHLLSSYNLLRRNRHHPQLRPHTIYHHTYHTTSTPKMQDIHPALRPTQSPLPYPNPNHPTSAYPPSRPPPALRYQTRASPGGVHTRLPSYSEVGKYDEGKGVELGVLEDKGGLLRSTRREEVREKRGTLF
ncbi:MAG: hypothetical protein Q9220_003713 [cf. Caloplaca sp. 1 TL-2023]